MFSVLSFLTVTLFSTFSFAVNADECNSLNIARLRIAIAGDNLLNANSTRTPEGGPYVMKIIKSCNQGGCDIKHDVTGPLMRYLPDHPDADKNGYVAFPNVDQKNEYALFNMAANELKLFAGAKYCNASIIENKNSMIITYNDGSIKSDLFNFDSDQKISSWQREEKNSHAITANFKPTGEVVSHQCSPE